MKGGNAPGMLIQQNADLRFKGHNRECSENGVNAAFFFSKNRARVFLSRANRLIIWHYRAALKGPHTARFLNFPIL